MKIGDMVTVERQRGESRQQHRHCPLGHVGSGTRLFAASSQAPQPVTRIECSTVRVAEPFSR